MSMTQEPITEAEAYALQAHGFPLFAVNGPANNLVKAYRAGCRDGSKPPERRVFRRGDPEPGPEVVALLDVDGDVWQRDNDGWDCGVDSGDWNRALASGPLVNCGPLPDYDAALSVDGERRAEEAAGGAS